MVAAVSFNLDTPIFFPKKLQTVMAVTEVLALVKQSQHQ